MLKRRFEASRIGKQEIKDFCESTLGIDASFLSSYRNSLLSILEGMSYIGQNISKWKDLSKSGSVKGLRELKDELASLKPAVKKLDTLLPHDTNEWEGLSELSSYKYEDEYVFTNGGKDTLSVPFSMFTVSSPGSASKYAAQEFIRDQMMKTVKEALTKGLTLPKGCRCETVEKKGVPGALDYSIRFYCRLNENAMRTKEIQDIMADYTAGKGGRAVLSYADFLGDEYLGGLVLGIYLPDMNIKFDQFSERKRCRHFYM